MADQSEKVTLAIELDMEMRKTTQSIAKFHKSLKDLTKLPTRLEAVNKKALKAFAEDIGKSTKGVDALQATLALAAKENSKFGKRAQEQIRATAGHAKRAKQAADDLAKASIKNAKNLDKLQRRMDVTQDAQEKKLLRESMSRATEAARAELDLKRDTYKKMDKIMRSSLKNSGASQTIEAQGKKSTEQKGYFDEALKAGKSFEFAMAEAVDKMNPGLRDVAKDFGEEFLSGMKDAVDSLKAKDLGGVGKGIGGGILKGLAAGGKSMSNWGEKNKDKGGLTGGAAGMVGSMGKGISGLTKSMAPFIQGLMKFGPILSLSAGILAGMLKLMIDVEAQAKGFNKEILESAGSASMLYKNGGKANATFKQMDKTLDSLRASAYNVGENMQWGIKAETHKAVINTFTQEGVSLDSLTESFEAAGAAAASSMPQIQNFGDLTHMGVTYSRLFGVSLGEISTMQAEMFTELGGSLGQIQLQFARMGRDAAESGIAANKFFNIIRSVSSDLALYNTRLEETTSILKLLGKSMSPKNAAKFLQTMSKGMKDMSEEDRIKQTLIAGEGKQREIVNKDIKSKEQLMFADIASHGTATVKEVQEAATLSAKDGGAAMNKILEGVPQEARSKYKEAMSEMKMDKNALKNGGVVGLAEASSNLSMGGAFESKKAALQRFGGKKKLSEMTGIEGFAARKATNTSLEEFRSMAKMEAAIDDQKKTMADTMAVVRNGGGTKEDIKMVERLDALGLTDQDKIKNAGESDIIRAMTRSDQDALAASQEQVNWAQKQAELTTSLTDKMDMVIEGIFEYLYVALKDIIGYVNQLVTIIASSKLFSPSGEEAKKMEVSKDIASKKNGSNDRLLDELNRSARDSNAGGDVRSRMAGTMSKTLDKGMTKSMADAMAEAEEKAIQIAIEKKNEGNTGSKRGLSPEQEKLAREQGRANFGQRSAQEQLGAKGQETLSNILKAGYDPKTKEGGMSGGQATSALSMITGLDQGKKDKFQKAMEENARRDPKKGGSEGGSGGSGYDASLSDPEAISKALEAAGFTAEELKAFADKSLQVIGTGEMTNLAASGGAFDASNVGKVRPTGGGAVAAATGGSLPAAVGPSAPKEVKEASAAVQTTATATEVVAQAVQKQTTQGVKLDKGFMTGDYERSTEKAMLAALRTALFEFALYTAKDPKQMLQQMEGSGLSAGSMASAFLGDSNNAKFLGDPAAPLAANASGGQVTGIANGVAQVSPAAGEGLASIGRGETIVPAGQKGGGRGDTFQINVNGLGGQDLARHLESEVPKIIYEYKRRERSKLCRTSDRPTLILSASQNLQRP